MTSMFVAISNYSGALLYTRIGLLVFYLSSLLRIALLFPLVKHTSNRGMCYKELSIRSSLYKIEPLFRDIVTSTTHELTFMFKLVYAIAIVVIITVVTVSLCSLAFMMFAS